MIFKKLLEANSFEIELPLLVSHNSASEVLFCLFCCTPNVVAGAKSVTGLAAESPDSLVADPVSLKTHQ